MKLAIISVHNRKESKDFVRAARNRKHQATLIHPKDITFTIAGSKTKAFYRGTDVLKFDAFLFYGNNAPDENFYTEKSMLALLLTREKKLVIEPTRFFGKFWAAEKLAQAGIPTPKSIYARSNRRIYESLKKIRPPYIIKPLAGSKGKGVEKIDTKKDLQKKLKNKDLEKIILQEYFPGDDHRVIVVGNKALGVMKKTPPPGDFRANISAGGKGAKVKMTPEFRKLAVAACRATDTIFGGVDVMRNGNKYTVLEVNRSPQFAGPIFAGVTKVDVAGEVIEYLEKKLRK